jgi:hypothetical protein
MHEICDEFAGLPVAPALQVTLEVHADHGIPKAVLILGCGKSLAALGQYFSL